MRWFGDKKVDEGSVQINMSYGEYQNYKKDKDREWKQFVGILAAIFVFGIFYVTGSFYLTGLKENLSPGESIIPAIVITSAINGIFLFWMGYLLMLRFKFPERFTHIPQRIQRIGIRLIAGYLLIVFLNLMLYLMVFLAFT